MNKTYELFVSLDAPKIECHDQFVYEWERNVALKCEIWSKPDATSLFWIIDDNGTTLYPDEVLNEFWILELVSRSWSSGYTNFI